MSKRRPGSELNHDNWDKEEDPEEAGEFQVASTDTLKSRKIIRPKRRLAQQQPATSSNPFAAFSAFAPATSNNNTPKTFAGFTFQKASSSSDSDTPIKPQLTAMEPPILSPDSEVTDKDDIVGNPGSTSGGLNVEPEKFSFATGLPFNSNKSTETQVGTTTGSDSASGNEISTSSESASLPPSLEPDSTYEARSDNGPCDSEKGNDEDESNENDICSEKSNTNEPDFQPQPQQNEPDSTEQ